MMCKFVCDSEMSIVTHKCVFFFFFKQKTAYEMRISDWSSDVCSSDLRLRRAQQTRPDSFSSPSGRRAPSARARQSTLVDYGSGQPLLRLPAPAFPRAYGAAKGGIDCGVRLSAFPLAPQEDAFRVQTSRPRPQCQASCARRAAGQLQIDAGTELKEVA